MCLLRSIKPLDVKCATREQIVGYLYLLNKKIDAINHSTDMGTNFKNLHLTFSSEFVYKALVDLQCAMEDYISVKDQMLYQQYAEKMQRQLCCDDGKAQRMLSTECLC